ncbi:MAG TPA: proline--tRNA ligase [Solirubrobacteraceae bacterium]|jgi:prolyl-tRNA synthetase|nr:proline--tRNA ligase [Solirubrobacteraceae bacterium]
MRLSRLFLPTERQPPADAEAISHKLMVRAGLVRQVGAGLWSWLPAGWRVHQRIVQIVREEIDAIGGQEMLMPVMHPAELWKRSGRYGFPEQFRLEDRKGAEHVLAMTHEEVVTLHVANAVRSYRDLPKILYHFQVKERDEPRPRAGVLRTREFIMKDSYTFDRDAEGLQAGYDLHDQAYARIFDRCGLEWYRVESDVGMMGGSMAHEFMAPCAAGENEVALAPGYAANVEVASAEAQPVEHTALTGSLDTPGATTIEAVAAAIGAAPGQLLKAFPVVLDGGERVDVFVRGDHRVNEIKLRNALKSDFRPAREDEIGRPAGFLGPSSDVRTVFDAAIAPGPYVAGANREGVHEVVTVDGGERLDVRTVVAGDTVNGSAIAIEPAIEVGNIFKLGTRYSEPLGASYLDESGREHPIWMGSYGIGPARIAAAAVEQFHDEQGIAWPKAIAPWDVEVVALGKPGSDEARAAQALYEELRTVGLDVVLDDRAAGAGEKFADAELLGCPLRLTVGRRSLESGAAEAVARRGRADLDPVPLDGAVEAVRERWGALP